MKNKYKEWENMFYFAHNLKALFFSAYVANNRSNRGEDHLYTYIYMKYMITESIPYWNLTKLVGWNVRLEVLSRMLHV